MVEAASDGGLELAATGDALGVRTASEAVSGPAGTLMGAEGDVLRLRLGLEGTWRRLELGGGRLEPSAEVGVRHDGGDAETGFGVDVGAGVVWTDPERGLEAQVRARGLLTHEDGGIGERGVAGGITWDPEPGSERGVVLTVQQTVGASASGGMEALLGRGTMAGLAANDEDDDLGSRRLEAKFGYGLSAFGGRFTATPEVGAGLSDTGRDYRLGWRLRRAGAGPGSLEFSLEATRRESANDNTGAEHGIGLRFSLRW